MKDVFKTELRGQQEWSWLLAVDLFLGGSGGGLFLLFVLLKLPVSVALLSVVLVMAGGLVLLAELGHPLRAWRALCKPLSSWISRGVIFVLLFLVAGSLYAAPLLARFSWLPWAPETLGGRILGVIAGVCALMVTLYPGFVLSASPSIPSWNSPFLPVLFLSSSLTGGSGVLLLLSPWELPERRLGEIGSLAALFIVANLALLIVYLLGLRNSELSAQEGMRRLREGLLGWSFKGGVIVVGMVIPLLLVEWVLSAAALAGACILVGGLLFRYCVLKSGVYVPFALT